MDDQGFSTDDTKQVGSQPTDSLPPLVKPKLAEEKKEETASSLSSPPFPKEKVDKVLAELEEKPSKEPEFKQPEPSAKEVFSEPEPVLVKTSSPPPPFSPPPTPEEEVGEKPKGGKLKKITPFLVLALILLSLPLGLLVVRQSQETRRSAECNPDPDRCWTINSQNSKEGCEAWCSEREEYEDSCTSYKVLNDECEEVECWSCKRKEIPTPDPGECQSGDLSKRTKEGCENYCQCTPGGDIYNEYEDTCQLDTDPNSESYRCWYCKTRPEPLNDCCSCWSDCTSLPCPEGLTCQDVSGTKRCVNPTCPTDQDCTCDQNPTPTPTTPVDEPTPTPTAPIDPTPTTPVDEPTPTPTTPTDEPTPTPTPPSSISCSYCRLYGEDWQLIDVGSSVFTIGQKLYLATTGTTSESAGITKARFRVTVNTQVGGWQISEQKQGNDFYLPYTVTQAGTYEIESMVYNPTLGWH